MTTSSRAKSEGAIRGSGESFTIGGMDCASCARTIESGVGKLPGVESCELSFATGTLRVHGSATREEVADRVRALGFSVTDAVLTAGATGAGAAHPPPSFLRYMMGRWDTRLALVAALLMLPALAFHELLHWQAWWIDLPALVALVIAGLPVLRGAWRSLSVNRELDIQVLMTIAAVGAVVIGAQVEAAMVIVLFSIGEALEGYTSERARHAVRSLMEVAPDHATRVRPHGAQLVEEVVPVAEVRVGDRILIRPGERIAMDARVLAGRSAVSEAAITGEPMPVEKAAGTELLAGSVNGEGALDAEVTRMAADSTVRRMIQLVEEAQERRAPVQRFVDRFAGYYTPAVVGLAVLVAIAPPLLFGLPFWNPATGGSGWLYRALALLVVACPCALVLSTPVSLVSALAAAARGGALIKGGAYLEALAGVRVVALDKTGTLTAGAPAVVAVRAAACATTEEGTVGHCADCDDVLGLAYSVERRSEHPLARAVVRASEELGLATSYPPAQEVTALVGRGVQGTLHGRSVTVASHAYFDEFLPHQPEHCASAARDAEHGHTPVMVGSDGAYVGTITMADQLRPTSREALEELARMQLPTVILTGDQEASARWVGNALGVAEIRAGLLPEQKLREVEALERRYGAVAMVGDGINDAPALARAAVGMAIGVAHGGTHQAMETADVTLMSDDLRRLPLLIRLARATMATVRANVIFSLGIKAVFMVLVLIGAGTMWMAVLADVGASLLVTLNGMRLLRFRLDPQPRPVAP